ncbi:MAG: glutaredoxin domain-containing protein [Candidatus Curtissbacteria bacterium]|nr:glutaredoxin domain-containing protein [Candidatus Curtissbacteria bacterium]
MPKITLYSTSTCPFCLMQKDYFRDKKIEYDEILIDDDLVEAMKMVEISGQMGVPFTVIDKDDGQKITILGFDRPRIDEALGIHD